jgi:hypothetical protein
MAAGPADFERRRDRLIERLASLVRNDPRLAALWLQGSLADGTSDPLSDVDAFIAVDDAAFDEVVGETEALVGRAAPILIGIRSQIPGLPGGHYLLDGPIKLDLFFEPVSSIEASHRPAARVLVDKAGVGPRLRTGWTPPIEGAAARLATVYGMTRQGATWPIRLLLRGQFSTFAMVELELINDYLVTFMAARVGPRLLFKNRHTVARLLPPEQQAELDALTRDLLAALHRRDLPALRDVHLRVNEVMVREGRAAFAALGLPYPGSEAGDAAIRAFSQRDWPDSLP